MEPNESPTTFKLLSLSPVASREVSHFRGLEQRQCITPHQRRPATGMGTTIPIFCFGNIRTFTVVRVKSRRGRHSPWVSFRKLNRPSQSIQQSSQLLAHSAPMPRPMHTTTVPTIQNPTEVERATSAGDGMGQIKIDPLPCKHDVVDPR